MSAFFNITSLTLGLIAWAIPLALLLRDMDSHAGGVLASGTACMTALLLQLCEIGHRVAIHDYPAIIDTIGAVIFAAMVLVAVTTVLNLAVCLRRGQRGGRR